MKEGFRQCMAWLHTWTGLLMGWVLFFIFITGTASYVRPELNQWMEPERPLTHNNLPTLSQQFNKAYDWLSQHDDARYAEQWLIYIQSPNRQSSDFHVGWQKLPKQGEEIGKFNQESLDLYTGQTLALENTPRYTGGGDALYRMHYQLHYLPYEWAVRIVGICTMLMFVAIITGVITHKKIFKDFFTFRPAKGQRSWLDAHNILSVIALPFYIMITYSGLIFFLNTYMPLGVPMTYGFGKENEQRYFNELYQIQPEFKDINKRQSIADVKDQFIDVKKFMQEKEQQWVKQNIRIISIYQPFNREPARIEFYKSGYENLARSAGSEQYNLITGQKINKKNANLESIPFKFSDTMFALHEGRFADGLIRWIYVITGLIGSGMIATGLILWTVKRRVKSTKADKVSLGHQMVEKFNIATIAGLLFAVAIYFWANRLIPVHLDERANWEINSLFIAWLFTFIYAICRPFMKAWREILTLAALAWLLLPVLNFFTTDRHLGLAISHGDWALVNIEIGFIFIGLILAWTAWKVQKRIHQPIPLMPARKVSQKKGNNNETV